MDASSIDFKTFEGIGSITDVCNLDFFKILLIFYLTSGTEVSQPSSFKSILASFLNYCISHNLLSDFLSFIKVAI